MSVTMYDLEFTDDAYEDVAYLRRTEPAAYRKLEILLTELMISPRVGTGRVEMMKYGYKGCYSRRITKKHRLVYTIEDRVLKVLVLSAYGHYIDK